MTGAAQRPSSFVPEYSTFLAVVQLLRINGIRGKFYVNFVFRKLHIYCEIYYFYLIRV